MSASKKFAAEAFGTFWLVFGGCGAAVLAGGHIGFLGIALAFGLTVLTMAFAVGHVSGCHLNPAVTFGLWASGRFEAKSIPLYIIAQLIGATLAAGLIYCIASGHPNGYDLSVATNTLAANGFGEHSPGGFSMWSAFTAETVLTFFFLFIILGATSPKAPAGFAPIAIGLGLTLIHLIGIPVTNLSVNPARSTGPALFVGGWALQQLWLFWIAPILGAILAGFTYKCFLDCDKC